MFIDTHCHIHDPAFEFDIEAVLKRAHENGVDKAVCIGTSVDDSAQAISVAQQHDELYATVGVHPHDVLKGYDIDPLLTKDKVVAVGEIGLDYHYKNSPRAEQKKALEHQIGLALSRNLPIVFHARDAFDDFWPIFDKLIGKKRDFKGVLHSFTGSKADLDNALARGLFISVNGISTFTKDEAQIAVFASVPLDKLLLETDAPFLTPAPFRGNVNEPAYIPVVADFFAQISGNSLEKVEKASTENAQHFFSI